MPIDHLKVSLFKFVLLRESDQIAKNCLSTKNFRLFKSHFFIHKKIKAWWERSICYFCNPYLNVFLIGRWTLKFRDVKNNMSIPRLIV